MSSTIAWLDQSDEHQRQMREAIGMFRDEGAVDELGMGRIRDVFSDRLFPGTSVLWRRARYLLFVPWIYRLMELRGGGKGSADEQARRLQRKLARSLGEAGEAGYGVIGVGGADVKQPPDTILWAALKTWGIRLDSGKLRQVRRDAARRGSRSGQLEEELYEEGFWHPRAIRLLPEPFPGEASFELEPEEAEFLAELLQAPDKLPGTLAAMRADSLLPVLLRDGLDEEPDLPWMHPMPSASEELRDAVDQAGCFSDAVQGARLLYAHLVAESQKDGELLGRVREKVDEWVATVTGVREAALRDWANGLDHFFAVVRSVNPHVGHAEEAFVRSWAEHALANPTAILSNSQTRDLVIERERQAKGLRKARLRPDGSIGRDARAVLPAQLTFRWGQARSIVDDIASGLEA